MDEETEAVDALEKQLETVSAECTVAKHHVKDANEKASTLQAQREDMQTKMGIAVSQQKHQANALTATDERTNELQAQVVSLYDQQQDTNAKLNKKDNQL